MGDDRPSEVVRLVLLSMLLDVGATFLPCRLLTSSKRLCAHGVFQEVVPRQRTANIGIGVPGPW